jgi:hypothetical protein
MRALSFVFSLIALAAGAACNGQILPVAENGPENGAGGGGQTDASSDANQGPSWCRARGGHCETPFGSGDCIGEILEWNNDQSCDGLPNAACCVPVPDAGCGANCPDSGETCGDAGSSNGVSCLCGEPTCVEDKWTCPSCSTDGGSTECSPACKADEVCVRDLLQGGPPVWVDDAGLCPQGWHPNGVMCQRDPTFFCTAIPAACNGVPSCECAASVCMSQQSCPYACRGSAGNEIYCECDVP